MKHLGIQHWQGMLQTPAGTAAKLQRIQRKYLRVCAPLDGTTSPNCGSPSHSRLLARKGSSLAADRARGLGDLALRTDPCPAGSAMVDGPELFPRFLCPGVLTLCPLAEPG